MIRALLPLVVRLAISAVLTLLVIGISRMVGLFLPLPLLLSVGLALGGAWWIIHQGADRADQLHAPLLDLDADYALPHAQDMRVRRLEDLAHGAQPSRRMTSRGLARTLGQIADERAHDPDAPALSPRLTQLIETARHDDAENHPVGPLDRASLHHHLRELASGEERNL